MYFSLSSLLNYLQASPWKTTQISVHFIFFFWRGGVNTVLSLYFSMKSDVFSVLSLTHLFTKGVFLANYIYCPSSLAKFRFFTGILGRTPTMVLKAHPNPVLPYFNLIVSAKILVISKATVHLYQELGLECDFLEDTV